MTAVPRIAVVGAGPIGLEAALLAVQSGFDVQVYERGSVAANVKDWGHVKLFSPFAMNASEWGIKAVVAAGGGDQLPAADDILTGHGFAERYLLPLSRLRELQARIHERCEVRALSRTRALKGDLIGSPQRGRDPFQLLLQSGEREQIVETDVVFDCSGTYPHHNWLGAGGMPCIGELDAHAAIDYQLPDVRGTDRERFANRTTLVVGGGYSAATAVVALARLSEEAKKTRAIWLTRSDRTPPILRIDDDRLSERDRLAERANRLATECDGSVEWHRATVVRRIERSHGEGFMIAAEQSLKKETRRHEWHVDRVIANVGYKPDRTLTEELQFHECYATGGPMKLAAALLGETSTDCCSQSSHGPDTLRNPEPGYFVLGSKSYGRDSRFLLDVGFQQIRDVMSLIQSC